MARQTVRTGSTPLHVSLVALPDAVVSTLAGIYDVMNGASMASLAVPRADAPFRIEVVGDAAGPLRLASGVPFEVQRTVEEIEATDILIVPSVLLASGGWEKGRYPRLVQWVQRMHVGGALVCSACSGIFLLAETGLFDGKDATVHFAYADTFASLFPEVNVHPEQVLVLSGERDELVTSGASNTWHDLALYLIARHAGATTAQGLARMFALQWHQEGLAPFIIFEGKTDHGDAAIADAQKWIATHFTIARPVEEMIQRSKMAGRTFKRRFTAATGLTPIAYVQRLRVEDAKRRLERTDVPVDDISWQVGYEDPAFFRRLFRRVTGMAPAAYRKRFRIPDFAR